MQPEPERDPVRLRDSVVLKERQRDGGLHEPDIPRPQREERRDVHQHEHEPCGGQHLVDPERAHRRVHREQLAGPSEHLEQTRRRGRGGTAHDSEPVTREPQDLAHRTKTFLDTGHAIVPRAHRGDREQRHTGDDDRNQARHCPLGNARGRNDVRDQPDHGNEVEDPVCEHRPEQPRPHTLLVRHAAGQDGDTRELADPSR